MVSYRIFHKTNFICANTQPCNPAPKKNKESLVTRSLSRVESCSEWGGRRCGPQLFPIPGEAAWRLQAGLVPVEVARQLEEEV